MRSAWGNFLLRAARLTGGVVLLALGLVFMFLPGPGLPLLFGGLLLLESEFHWARRARSSVVAFAARARKSAGSTFRRFIHRCP